MRPTEIMEDIYQNYEVNVTLRKCGRAKGKALNAVQGLMKRQYGLIKPYMRELLRSNPGTTCILKVHEGEAGEPTIFMRFYVCFQAMKSGFTLCSRRVFGVDGCFLKHACGGQLLCAVGKDGNNQMWPIAWAVVEGETRNSWDWFLRILSNDLLMGDGKGWTVISDQQKGLVPAIHEVWPEVEHRQCARHIYSNWRKQHGGRVLQKQFWTCVKATSMPEFAYEATKLRKLSEIAYEGFMAGDPNTFCKSHFKCHSKCDSVDNNMAETFNSFILLARYKPIVSMLEDIRLALLDRMQEKLKLVPKFVDGVAPRIHKKLKEAYNEQIHCEVHWNGNQDETGFEVKHRGMSHHVNLAEKTCSCRVWDLSGIPCTHAISAILKMRKRPNDFLSHFYQVENYIVMYAKNMNPIQGSKFWDKEGEGMVLPPNIVKRTKGRPKTARRRDASEGSRNSYRSSRQGLSQKCSHCGSGEHRMPNCPHAPPFPPRPANQQESQNLDAEEGTIGRGKRGRPKGSKTRTITALEDLSRTNSIPASQMYIANRARARAESQTQAVRGGSRTGRGRGRGRGMARGRSNDIRVPEGYGLWHGDHGEVAYIDPTANEATILHGSTQTSTQNASQVQTQASNTPTT